MPSKEYNVIGLMSGSSMDGLDIAYCTFEVDKQGAEESVVIKNWDVLLAETVPFSEKWKERLMALHDQNALIFSKTHTYFGHYMGELVNDFLQKHDITPDFIASHGHTIFHYPENRLTVQIGDGAAMAAVTGYPVVSNFRTQDIAIDGEGAPLAPLADRYLFEGYDFYLNLGGIANITCDTGQKYVALDIGAANQILNVLAEQLDKEYDENGNFARKGQLNPNLLNIVNDIPFFKKPYPKSLDNQWVQTNIVPKYMIFPCSWEDKLHTACVQLAAQIKVSIESIIQKEQINKDHFKLFITGGGTLNSFLIEKIEEQCNAALQVELVLPSKKIIEFKEAALMALLGVLRVENIPNSMHSVTGATRDTIGGAIYQGNKVFI